MQCFLRDEVNGIICTLGGWNANDVLPLLDYQAIAEHPKVFVGFSDITALHCALLARAGIVTFHGPSLLPTFGEAGGPAPFTVEWFMRAVSEQAPLGVIADPGEFTDELLWWETEDTRPRKYTPAVGLRCVVPGRAEGRLFGGNLATLITLVGTEYFPPTDGAILLLEDEEGTTAQTERDLQCLQLHGALDGIRGIIFGRPYRYHTVSPQRTLEQILSEIGYALHIPVMTDVACSHTDPMLTLPLGVQASLDAENGELCIEETAVISI